MTDTTRTLIQIFIDLMRVVLVYAVFALLLMFLMANWSLPYFQVLKPQIVLVAVFYWTLYRPTLMPPWVIFGTGLLLDALNPVMPFGTHAFSYLLIAGILKPRRRMLMGQPFMMTWVVFIGAVIMDMIIKYIVISIFTATSINMSTVVLNGLVTTLFFPLILMILVWVHRLLPATRGMIAS